MIGPLADEVGAGATSAPQGRSRGHGFCYAPIRKELLSDSEVLVSARFFSLRYLLLYEHTSYTCFAGGGFHGGLAPVAPFRDPLPPPIICCVLLLVGLLSCSCSLGSCVVVGGEVLPSHPSVSFQVLFQVTAGCFSLSLTVFLRSRDLRFTYSMFLLLYQGPKRVTRRINYFTQTIVLLFIVSTSALFVWKVSCLNLPATSRIRRAQQL